MHDLKASVKALFILAPLFLLAAQQGTTVDFDKLIEKADALLEEAKKSYEEARDKSSVPSFVDAGFKLEECRIKFMAIQEIGPPDKQKVAVDRLRSVNQLAKLIHDGRVAIAGPPAEGVVSSPDKPAPGEPSKAPAPPKESVDLSKRAPVPDAVKLKDAEKLVKDLYREQYAKKAQSDRKALGRQLLAELPRNRKDALAYFVLCREAQDQAIQGCDLPTALGAIDAVAELFDVDGIALRNAAVTATAKIAKTPEEAAEVVTVSFRMIEEFIATDQYEAADKLSSLMLPLAKRSGSVALFARMTSRSKYVSDAKALYQGMKGVLETLAKNPEDSAANSEMAKFLCFVKGNWDLGLRFSVKGSDAVMKGLAEKELKTPTQSLEWIGLADGWWDFAEKEKSPLRKMQLVLHAKALYESALVDASGLAQARVDKRLKEIEQMFPETAGGPIDLLRMLAESDSVVGQWKLASGLLYSPMGAVSNRIQIPYTPPAEYVLTLIVERKEGTNCLMVGLAAEGQQSRVMIDGGGTADITGLERIDGAGLDTNETRRKGQKYLPMNRKSTVIVTVRKTGVVATVDGVSIVDWKGPLNKLSLDNRFAVPNKSALFVAAWDTRFEISKIQLTPISGGSGKSLR